MNGPTLLLIECLASLAVSFAVLIVLSRPLLNALKRICPDEQAAAFWLSYSRVMLTITPLALVLLVDLLSRFKDPANTVQLALIASLAALLLGLRSIGNRLGRFVVAPKSPENRS